MADERETFFGNSISVPRRGTKEEGPLAPFPKAPRHETEGAGKAVSAKLGPKAGHLMSPSPPKFREWLGEREVKGLSG